MASIPSQFANDPPSPCIGVCIINPETQFCEGCARTLDEIAAWLNLTPSQKCVVLKQLDGRITTAINGQFHD